jgi:hypothetical protein
MEEIAMRIRALLAVIATGLLLAGASLAAVKGGATSNQLPLFATYQPLPKDATTYGGVSLKPLPRARYSSVAVTAAEALDKAERTTGITVSGGVSEVTSLGSFTDGGLRHDGSLIAKGTTAYVVTFSGLSLPTLGTTGGTVAYDAVAINAATGKVIENVEFN